MADGANPFDQFDPDMGGKSPAQTLGQPAQPNIFDQFDPDMQPENKTSGGGAFLRSTERGALPAAGGLAGMGAGAEVGAGFGALVGGPAAPITATIGGVLGGVAGAFGGSALIGKAQDWALHQLPDSWTEKLGQDD